MVTVCPSSNDICQVRIKGERCSALAQNFFLWVTFSVVSRKLSAQIQITKAFQNSDLKSFSILSSHHLYVKHNCSDKNARKHR